MAVTTRQRYLPRVAALDRADRRAILIAGDVVSAFAAAVIGLVIWGVSSGHISEVWLIHKGLWTLVLSASWMAAGAFVGTYVPANAARSVRSLGVLVSTAGLVFMSYSIVYFFAPRTMLPRVVVLAFAGCAILIVGSWRRLWDWASGHPSLSRPVVVVGAGGLGERLARVLTERPNSGYRVIGFVDDDPSRTPMPPDAGGAPTVPILGRPDELGSIVRDFGAAEVVLAFRGQPSRAVIEGVVACHELGVVVSNAADLYEATTGRFPIWHVTESLDGLLSLAPLGRALYIALKRAVDIVVSTIGLTSFGLALPVIAFALKLDSSGPVFYRQSRSGRGGRVFRIWKVRTMAVNAEGTAGPSWAAAGDPRMTRVGRFLRRTHIDEIPQLVNVLRGEMSIVGPRPERPEIDAHLEQMIPLYRLRLAVKPGIAGWGAVNGPYVDDVEKALERLEYDLYYINHQSSWLDLQIIAAAVYHAVSFRGR